MYLNVLKILKNNIFCLYQFDIHFAFLFVSVIVGRYAATMDLQNRYSATLRWRGRVHAAIAAHASMLGSHNPRLVGRTFVVRVELPTTRSRLATHTAPARVARGARIRDARRAVWQ